MHIVYQLTPGEYHRYRNHLLALDEQSRYTRFGFHVKDDVLHKLCDGFEAMPDLHKIFVIENSDLDVVAAGHISLGNETELAFSVLKPYQGQGMGSSLMKRCIEYCQNRGIKDGCMVCLSSNTAIKKLASKYGILVSQGGEAQAEISIPKTNPLSICNEMFDTNMSTLDHYTKIQRKIAKIMVFPLTFLT